jgi:hyperosmotically inducible protein
MVGPRQTVDMPSTSTTNNTVRNERDKNGESLSSIKQSQTKSDIDLVARIRREINKDHALSMTAKNIKIIPIEGRVTLRGPVKTELEKSEIEARAAAIAGSTNIDYQLEVVTEQP